MPNDYDSNYSLMSLTLEISSCLLINKKYGTSIIQLICNKLISQYPYKMAWIGLLESDGSIHIESVAGETAAYLNKEELRWDTAANLRNPLVTCILKQKPVCLEIKSADEQFGKKWDDFLNNTHSNSLLLQPLFNNSKCMGLLCIHSKLSESFLNKTECALLAMIAQHLSCYYES